MKSLSANLYLTHTSNSSLQKGGLIRERLSLLFVPLPALLLSVSEFINGRDPSEHDVFLQNSLGDKKNDWQLQKLHLRFGPEGKGGTNCLWIICKSLMSSRTEFKRLQSFPNTLVHVSPSVITQTPKWSHPCKTPLLFFILLKYGDGKCVNAEWCPLSPTFWVCFRTEEKGYIALTGGLII